MPLFSVGESIPNVSSRESEAWNKLKINFDFIFHRHLEHLLSVCAIPISSYESSNNTSAVALTCGDISGHWICISASLKVPVYGEFDETKPSRNLFVDTAFQIIKAGEFAEHYSKDSGNKEWQLARKVIERVYDEWITHLDKLDERDKFVWPRSQREDLRVFRLDDHAWIFRTLKLAELIIFSKNTQRGVQEHTITSPERQPKSRSHNKYSCANVQREVLQRFTVHNQYYQPKKRMLAATRSVRESRRYLAAWQLVLLSLSS
ncbi:hypothetical protein BofuT4_P136860.1 [Botrytis cinerea T4]|uniref:Uncharacterized protein n=1 Tax=Botryotinia fuckeliana (strain T4) TaxID=999810 RepID=G2YPU3_BOTF4|nr:hypothetical protein BofuT4_P136860.1 [Botrytis cinerea T4]